MKHKLFKRAVAAVLILLVFCSGFPIAGFAEQNNLQVVKLQLRWDNQFQFAGYYAADWQGYYAEEGIKVEIISAIRSDKSVISSVKEVSEGRADFGIGSADILIANDKGADLRVVSVIMQRSAARYYLKEETRYSSLSDLTRLRVARNVNDLIDIELQAMLLNEGIDPNQVEAYPHQAGMDHLISDDVQVIPGYKLGLPYISDKKGIPIKEINPQEYGVDFYGDSLFVSGTLVDQNPELVEKFKRASLKGWEYAFNHSEEIASKISSDLICYSQESNLYNYNIFQAQVMKELAEYPIVEVGHINPYRWQKMSIFLKQIGLIEKEVDVNKLIFDPVKINTEKMIRQNALLEKVGLFTFGLLILIGSWGLFLRRAIKRKTSEIRSTEVKIKENENRFREVLKNLEAGVVIHDAESRIMDCNQRAEELLGLSKEQLLGVEAIDPRWVFQNEDGTNLPIEEYPVMLVLNGKRPIKNKVLGVYDPKADHITWVTVNGTPIYNHSGDIAEVAISFIDITERKKNEMVRFQQMKDLMESQRIAHIGTWRLTLETNEVFWSEELYKMYGFDPTLPVPPYTELRKLFTHESWLKLSSAVEHTITTGIPYELELETIKVDGLNGWMWVRGEAEKDPHGKISSLWGAAQDVSERKNYEKELEFFAHHDHLTGLYNRRYFEESLVKLDTEENLPLSIIMCDVNGLKLINDSFGHIIGDEFLKKAAESMEKACRAGDVVFRLGGDEFAIILPKSNAEGTLLVANQIKEIASKINIENIELSIAYGYDTKTIYEQSIVEIVASAENHMYRHKLYERSSVKSKTIEIIMKTLFEKSARESQHSARVSRLCQAIATKLNFDSMHIERMRVSGLVHDIGKIGVDEKILNKSGLLSGDERREIIRHPEIGWRILSTTNEFSELAQFVLNHHERWDGGGYPNGLKGDKIPLESRIIAVADSYDAMTSNRPYQKAMDKAEAIKEMLKCSGSQFDSEIVDVFVNQVLSEDKSYGG